MTEFEILYTVNAGLYFRIGDAGLLLDALHDGSPFGFSDTSPLLLRDMRAREGVFRNRNDLVCTHSHPDHFEPALVDEFSRLYPASRIAVLGKFAAGVREEELAPDVCRLRLGAFELLVVTTEHQPMNYTVVPHRALILTAAGRRYLICGDALLTPEAAARLTELGGTFDAAFINAYHIAMKEERAALETIPARRLYLYHLPFPADDIYHFRNIVRSAAARLPASFPPLRVLEPDPQVPLAPIEGETL